MNLALLLLYLVSFLFLVGYYLYFFLPIITAQHKEKNTIQPPISVVICAKNEATNLKYNLPCLLNQNYPDFEVLVINDHSSDDTQNVLQEFMKKHYQLRTLEFTEEKKTRGKKEALAFGIANAKYEHLLLTDADCQVLSNNWIAKMSEGFSQKSDLVLGISLYPYLQKSFLNWVVSCDSILIAINYIGWAIQNKPYMSVGRNVAYTKSLFSKVGGFSNHLDISSGDDDLFVQEARLHGSFNYVIHPESQTTSAPVENWKAFIKQKSRHHSTGIKYPLNILIGLAAFQISVLVFYSSFILLLLHSSFIWTVLLTFFVKNILQTAIFKRIFSKIGVKLNIAPFLVFELIWVILLIRINFKNLFSTKKNGDTWS